MCEHKKRIKKTVDSDFSFLTEIRNETDYFVIGKNFSRQQPEKFTNNTCKFQFFVDSSTCMMSFNY